mmetsp:Transcript_40319/g.48866  ORF Transcript_40319/g.48866 Transcript_40319/m.48866 type:complete len:98 (-) Transcript_40319:381-674(-)
MRMAFVLPASYSAASTPTPTDSQVAVGSATWPPVAVVTFSGWTTQSDVSARQQALEQAVTADGHEVVGPPMLARYNPPWTLGPLRTNEIFLPISVKA